MAEPEATITVAGALEAAAQHHAAGRLGDAERLYDAVLAALPAHAEALHRRGIVAFQRGDLDRSTELVRRAIAADPDAPEPHNSLGNILLSRDDHAGAAACYRTSLALQPDVPVVRINLGIALYGAGRVDEAAATLAEGLRGLPAHAQARAALAQIALDRGDDDEAARQLRAAALLDRRFAYCASVVLGDDLEAYTAADGLDEMLAAAPALEGEMPARGRPDPVVVTCCDHGYFRRFAQALARSLDANAPGHDLHIHVFEPAPGFADEIAALGAGLGRTTLTASHERGGDADPIYYANMRLVRLHQIMSACRRPVLSLDADSLVCGTLDGAAPPGAEIAVTLRPDKAEIGQKVLATTLWLGATPVVGEFLRRVACYVLNCYHEERLAWYLDQSVLYLVHRMMAAAGEAPTLAPLPASHADSAFRAGSAIWAAKGERKSEPAFMAEVARYAAP